MTGPGTEPSEPVDAGFVITGHRGAMAVEPENTMRSFARAVAEGVDELELDVRLTRDGHLAVMHDHTVDRTTNGSGSLAELTWSHIQSLDAGLGERVPELCQVWSAFPDLALQVEIKDLAATVPVLELARAHPRAGALMITSFAPEIVTQCLESPGAWQVGLICGARDEAKLTQHLTDQVRLLVHWQLREHPAVIEFRRGGGRARVWASRTADEVVRALDEGWEGTTADDPGVAVSTRAAWASRSANQYSPTPQPGASERVGQGRS